MAKTTVTFASNTTLLIQQIKKINRELDNFTATVLAYGTFGGGTLAFYLSPDGGTTLIPLTAAIGGTGFSCTANAMFELVSGHASTNTDLFGLYATMSGATSPSVVVASYDNNK